MTRRTSFLVYASALGAALIVSVAQAQSRDEAVMRLHWGTTALPIRIKAAFKPPA